MTQLLHFTLGPVQGFVAEARRTRDLWAGSFLLSWLSAHAMRAVEQGHGKVIFPDVATDALMMALRSGGKAGNNPYIGSVPNRFKAEVPDGFDPKVCAEAVMAPWLKLAEKVWQEFVAPVVQKGSGTGTEVIWKRQIGSVWEMAWVLGEDPGDRTDGAWLEARKNWRAPYPAAGAAWYEEGGDHCQLMGHLQELSGQARARGEDERTKQNTFWAALQSRPRVGVLNLRDRERLSAIALIKRLFPVLPDETLIDVIGWVPGKEPISVKSWPSVSYVAAAPWLATVWDYAGDSCETYRDAAERLLVDGARGETATRILGRPGDERWRDEFSKAFFKLDGHLYHRDAIRSMPLDCFKGRVEDEKKTNRLALEKAFVELSNAIESSASVREQLQSSVRLPPRTASEFYAVLIMDGDEIGKRLRQTGGEALAKAGLAEFTRRVPAIVEAYMGVTVYAGGDDVLALLPIDTAIAAALEIRSAYVGAFQCRPEWTLSASIVFAQYHIPLRAVLSEVRTQLDGVAKRGNGRDSLALCVLKPGGAAFNWVSTWEGIAKPEKPLSVLSQVEALARGLQKDRGFTTGFFYNVRDRYGQLFDKDEGGAFTDGKISAAQIEEQMRLFLEAEYRESGGKKEEAEGRVEAFMPVAMTWRRQPDLVHPGQVTHARSRAFNFDAGPMIRFLAEQARWFMKHSAGRDEV